MDDGEIVSLVRDYRQRAGLSQAELAERTGVSRQTLVAVEAGRQVPSTHLALLLARALSCNVDDLFRLRAGTRVRARLARASSESASSERRVVVGRVDGALVAHRVQEEGQAADAVLASPMSDGVDVELDLLTDLRDLDRNLLVAGCAPLLGTLAARQNRLHGDSRVVWVSANSGRAIELWKQRLVHIAGVHLAQATEPQTHARIAQAAFPESPSTLIHFARWHQGIVVARGNPLGIKAASDLARGDVRIAAREPGSGAHALLQRLLGRSEPANDAVTTQHYAANHGEVARMVRWGLADAGIAIESAAVADGLDFVPLSDERFDLLVSNSHIELPIVRRFLDALDSSRFRSEAATLPGYDLSATGHALSVAVKADE